jgi:hypothetical protein
MNPAEFCREIEAYLCRKNEGHLIRIVGPVFDQVCGWAAQGVPLKVAHQGIDRYFERRRAKGPSRRPVRVEFCEADILDAFDDWRRAVGVGRDMGRGDDVVDDDNDSADGVGDAASVASVASVAGREGRGSAGAIGATGAAAAAGATTEEAHGASDREGTARRKGGLHTHIDRVMARLTQRRVESGLSSGLGEAIDRLLSELDALRARAKGARQEARVEVIASLRRLDDQLIDSARAALDADQWSSAQREARDELESFRGRMDPSAYERALQAATARAFRDRVRLPIVSSDE